VIDELQAWIAEAAGAQVTADDLERLEQSIDSALEDCREALGQPFGSEGKERNS
jgi:hypothetical protein